MKWSPYFLLGLAAVVALINISHELHGIRYQLTLLACVQMAKAGTVCTAAKEPADG